MEHVVQPADCAVLSRDYGQSVPYWVYGAQQESGSAATMSRSDYGEITFREWHPAGVFEYGYIAVDPLDSIWCTARA